MSRGKSAKLWLVNQLSFIFFIILGITGLINWLILPRGPRMGTGFLIDLRHFFRIVHEWTALGFVLSILIHIYFHWGYIKNNVEKRGFFKLDDHGKDR